MSKGYMPIKTVDDDGLFIADIGNWAEKKYKLQGHYCNIFTSAMRNKWNLVYIDLFAGCGYSKIRETKRIIMSSPLIALTVPHTFDYYIFNELDSERYSALKERCTRLCPAGNFIIHNLDANNHIESILNSIPTYRNRKGTLIFCFIDPYSLNLQFSTIETLAKNKVDILMLMALQMDGQRNEIYYVRVESTKIEEYLGDKEWRMKYNKESGKFIKFLSDQYDLKMEKLGYIVQEGLKTAIKMDSGHGLYYMAYYSKNNLGNRFYKEIEKASNDQLSLF
jgi:three-Cys-motif partner protein